MVIIKKFRQEFINPAFFKRRGIVTNIKRVTIGGGEVIIEFEEEPTAGEIQQIKAFLNQDRWEEVEE